MRKNKNKKVVKFHKATHFNIGVAVFLLIFVYMLYNTYQYFTKKQVAVYEVSQGTIAQNDTYTGVILREEKLYHTETSGYINYFNRDATRVGVGSYVYSIDETGDFYQSVKQQNDGQLFSDADSYENLEKTASGYVAGYSDESFYQVYAFLHDMEAELMEAASENALSSLGSYAGGASGLHTYQASEPGVIVYNTDGLEQVTLDNLTEDVFDESAHARENLMARERVSAGDPAYKLITDEAWTLVVPISDSIAKELKDEGSIQVEFKKDGTSAWGEAGILTRGGGKYLTLRFQNSMIRFATDRYLDIKLLRAEADGLKIPVTALTKKDFFLVPKEYLTKGGENSSNGLMRQYLDEDGKTVMEFLPVDVAEENEKSYYVEGDGLGKGDTIVKPDSTEHYTIGETASLQGVYNINKGYAVFRKVEILFQNQEYAIVDTGTNYGISLYDYIALDASAVTEDEIVQQ